MTAKEKRGGSFVVQAAILASASLIVRFIGFLYRLPLTELIGDEGNGIYNAGYQIYTFLLILSSAGLPAAIHEAYPEQFYTIPMPGHFSRSLNLANSDAVAVYDGLRRRRDVFAGRGESPARRTPHRLARPSSA